MKGEKEIDREIHNELEYVHGQRDGEAGREKLKGKCFDYSRGYRTGKRQLQKWKDQGLK